MIYRLFISLYSSIETAHLWTGMNDIQVEGNYMWANQIKLQYKATWAPRQPDDLDSNEDCVAIDGYHNYHYTDLNCTILLRFICQSSFMK